MKRLVSVLLILMLAVLLPASSLAGSRYYSSKHYHGGYRSHYHPHIYGHSHYRSDRSLAYLGVGLLAGAVVGSVLYRPPVERRVVYAVPPPVIVYRNPVLGGPQSEYYPQSQYYPQSDYPDSEVLRQVTATASILNIRSGPGLEEEIIGQAVSGEVLGVIGAAPEWLYVKTSTGQYGWVMARYTQPLEGPVG